MEIYIIYSVYNDFDFHSSEIKFYQFSKIAMWIFDSTSIAADESICSGSGKQCMGINRNSGHNVSVIFLLPVAGSAVAAGIERY